MRVACHFTIPEPPYLELDAAVQDGLRIVTKLGGEINFLYPGKKVLSWFPQALCGFQQLGKLLEIDKRVDIHHVFSNGFYPFPIYKFLKKPIVVSTVIGLQQDNPIKFPFLLKSVKRFIVPTSRDSDIMHKWGYENVSVVLPGIDLASFTFCPCASSRTGFTLLMGSAPWSKKQFCSKGIDLLLQVMKELEWLRVVFLWRGICLDDMIKRIEAAGVGERVSLITKQVNVNDMFADVHGAIVLAKDMQIIKPYPHSILESLAAGKPVIVSECLQVSEFVKESMGGVVVGEMDLASLKNAIVGLRQSYMDYCKSTRRISLDNFSSESMVQKLALLYDSVVENL